MKPLKTFMRMIGFWFGNDKTPSPPFMAGSAREANAMDKNCLSFGLVKTCQNKEVVKEA